MHVSIRHERYNVYGVHYISNKYENYEAKYTFDYRYFTLLQFSDSENSKYAKNGRLRVTCMYHFVQWLKKPK